MKHIVIEGGYPLSGSVSISGAKNSAVAILPAALLADGIINIDNVPNITDRDALFDIIKVLNCDIVENGSKVTIDTTKLTNNLIPNDLSVKLRASYYFMGVLLGRFKHVEIFFPGGCNIGTRPIDMHLDGFKRLGATLRKTKHKYILDAKELKGNSIYLDFASVGATINIMFAAVYAKGITTIHNAAKEVEIINIAEFLNSMGANITGAGTDVITITGSTELLKGTEFRIIPDRIEAGTYAIMGALLGNDFKVNDFIPEHNQALLLKFDEMGVNYRLDNDSIILNKSDNLKAINVKTLVYPGFPTDLGQPMSVLLTQAEGVSLFEETIWENRMGHMPCLKKMGADITVNGLSAVIKGKTDLVGTDINANDLRGGSSLIIAGLIASGTTTISDIDYILRGYEKIIHKLSDCGAKISLEEI